MGDFVLIGYGRHGGNPRGRPQAGWLLLRLPTSQSSRHFPLLSSSTNTTKPSRACGMSDSSAATASGGVTGTPPSPAISIAACSNQVSPAAFARCVAPSFSWLSLAKVADSARRAACPAVALAKAGAKRSAIFSELLQQEIDTVAVTAGSAYMVERDAELVALLPRVETEVEAVVAELVRPDGSRERILRLYQPDPEWPRKYWLEQPIALPSGSRIEVKVTPSEDAAPVVLLDLVSE